MANAESVNVDLVDVIRRVLRAGGVPEHRIEWMARSCPSLELAILFYPPKDAPSP